MTDTTADGQGFLPRTKLESLFDALRDQGYRVLGPQVRDGAIVYERLDTAAALPAGVHQRQAPGEYRLQHDTSPRCFAWANGPQALKPQLFAPRETLWQVTRDAQGRLTFTASTPQPEPLAVLGVRACDLAALALQDAHFLHDDTADPYYRQRRAGLLLIAVDCSHPAATCFCVSTGDGPQATQGFDIALSELDDGYLCRAASAAGQALLAQLPLQAVTRAQQDAVQRQHEQAVACQHRGLPAGLAGRLQGAAEHPHWQRVAERCLACGNCTSVCPTCFCYSEHDEAALGEQRSEHLRQWDSCFSTGHSYIHGHVVRGGTRERYRQWLTHKLDGWHEQYGRSGCVGCGRCITWCPVGIDLTAEVAELCDDG